MAQQPKTPFVKIAGKYNITVEVGGEKAFASAGDLNLSLTEDNAAAVLEAASPQIMQIVEQAMPLLAKAMVSESLKSQKPARHQITLEDLLRNLD